MLVKSERLLAPESWVKILTPPVGEGIGIILIIFFGLQQFQNYLHRIRTG